MPAPASAAGAANPAAGANAQGNGGTDWRWTIARSLLLYFGVQALTGNGGLLQKYFAGDKAPAPTNADLAAQQSQLTPGAASPGTYAPVPTDGSAPVRPSTPAPRPKQSNNNAPVNSMGQQVWPLDAPVDFYVFVSQGAPASQDDVKTQFSPLVHHGLGPKSDAIDFSAYKDTVLNDGLRDLEQVIIAPQTKRNLPAVRWSNVDWSNSTLKRKFNVELDVSEDVRTKNHTLWADVYMTLRGVSPDPSSPTFRKDHVFHTRKLLSRLLPAKKKVIERKLLKADAEEEAAIKKAEEEAARLAEAQGPVTWWHHQLTLLLVQQQPDSAIPLGNLPPPISQYVYTIPDAAAIQPNVFPIYPIVGPKSDLTDPEPPYSHPSNFFAQRQLFPNDFWHLREHMFQFNASTTKVPLEIELYTGGWMKFQMLAAMSDSFDKNAGIGASELDMIKTSLMETSPWFLGLTIGVSILHSLFEFLAFSTDVKDWRNKKDFAGVSVGSILTNVFVQLIILLYLLDSREDTSWTVLLGQGAGMAIEAWKLTKAITVGIVRTPKTEKTAWRFLPYKLDIKDKHVLSEEEKQTQEYDRLAFKYVGIAASPLLVGYTIYSALYQTHKGWWSFIIGTLCSFVYTFGFVSLVPQLIVNYKLKSTAGMNAKTMIFKTLTTVVDDLFAFCIKMPTLHRLACFRDDIVFVIFLYQRWIYGVDPSRVNEFGQVLDPAQREKLEKEKAEKESKETKKTQ